MRFSLEPTPSTEEMSPSPTRIWRGFDAVCCGARPPIWAKVGTAASKRTANSFIFMGVYVFAIFAFRSVLRWQLPASMITETGGSMKIVRGLILIAALALVHTSAHAQTSASTTCTTVGNVTNCDTTSSSIVVPGPANGTATNSNPNQAPAGSGWLYGASQSSGSFQQAGNGMGNVILRHRVKKFCHKHPADGSWKFSDGFTASCSDINKVMGW